MKENKTPLLDDIKSVTNCTIQNGKEEIINSIISMMYKAASKGDNFILFDMSRTNILYKALHDKYPNVDNEILEYFKEKGFTVIRHNKVFLSLVFGKGNLCEISWKIGKVK